MKLFLCHWNYINWEWALLSIGLIFCWKLQQHSHPITFFMMLLLPFEISIITWEGYSFRRCFCSRNIITWTIQEASWLYHCMWNCSSSRSYDKRTGGKISWEASTRRNPRSSRVNSCWCIVSKAIQLQLVCWQNDDRRWRKKLLLL